MPRLPWTGLPHLPWRNRDDATGGQPPAEGLVLSGGGSRASFQLGALRYLYDRADIAPSTFVGTSAGSIITVMLAQHADRDDQAAALRALESLWLGMRSSDEMFTPRPWFVRLQERGSEWLGLLQTEAAKPAPKRSLPKLGFFRTPEEEAVDAPDERAVEPEELTGQARTLQLAMADPITPSRGFDPGLAMGLMSMLPRLRSAGDDLSLILRGADASRSMYHPGTLLTRLLDAEFFTSQAVAQSGVTVRISMVALESGQLRFMTENGDMVDRENQPLPDIPRQDLSMGSLASCSIPTVFAPVPIGEEWYVDGGTRESTPAEMAIGHLGVERCYVVVSNAVEDPPSESFAHKSMLSIMFRATQILTEEAERDEVAYARNAGALVIEPELFIHDALTVDPGLLRINRDYGWLRAAEAHLQLPTTTRAIHRRVIGNRVRALELERRVLEGPAPEALLRELTRLKLQVRDDLAQLDSTQLPEDAASWWSDWERHVEDVARRPVWLP